MANGRVIDKAEMLRLRLDGYSYQHIADVANISRQRVQQLLSPPSDIRNFIVKKYEGRCVDCGVYVGQHGHVHHNNSDSESYQDIENLELLCIGCHRKRHPPDNMNTRNEVITKLNEQGLSYGQIAKAFGITRQRVCQIVNKGKKNLTRGNDKGEK